jgi:hypothetical protein
MSGVDHPFGHAMAGAADAVTREQVDDLAVHTTYESEGFDVRDRANVRLERPQIRYCDGRGHRLRQ